MKPPRRILTAAIAALLALAANAQTNTFPATGSVGIGTLSPGAKLHVDAGTSHGLLITTANSGPWGFMLKDAAYSGGMFSIFQAENGWAGIYDNYPNGSCVLMGPEGTINLAPNAGNVGIGTSSPASRFHVTGGDISIDPGRGIRKAGDNWIVGYQTEWPGIVLGSGATGDKVIINAGGVERMRIDTNGNVGIGANVPGTRLDIGAAPGAGYGTVSIKQSAGGQKGIWLQAFENTNSISIFHTGTIGHITTDYTGTGSIGPLVLQTTGGNVGIGTLTPTHKLSVNGAIRAHEVIVDTGWSDYVFKPDYRLPPLSEVEAHIRQHGTLPGVPSEAQVAKEGVSVGEMQAKLLAKIEELTLHQIEQEKRIEAQNTRIEQLERTQQ